VENVSGKTRVCWMIVCVTYTSFSKSLH